MKMSKRMAMKDVSVGDIQFKIRPLAAMDAAYVFGDVAALVLPILGTVALSNGDDESESLAIFDGYDLDAKSITSALSTINGKSLTRLISELVLDHKNVSFLDEDQNVWRPMDEDDFNEIFCMKMAGALNLCVLVIQQNYGGFFGDMVTLFGRLVKSHEGDQSKDTETLTVAK